MVIKESITREKNIPEGHIQIIWVNAQSCIQNIVLG
jgi:hypothetical protein